MSIDRPTDARLRPHPATRFAPPQVAIDLAAIASRLRREPQAGEAGHRQETIYKQGGLTVALFVFDRFTGLPEHQAAGTVTIQVVRGALKVRAESQEHELGAGQILVLAPGLRHAITAGEESEMLLTVCLSER